MLPKIVVGWQKSVDDFAINKGLSLNRIIQTDGSTALIADLRDWLNFCVNLTKTDKSYVVLINNADKLSPDSQSILLKPLEEKDPEVVFYLLVKSENGLLPTITSRCEVCQIPKKDLDGVYWPKLIGLWKKGPAEIIEFCEKVTSEEVELLSTEVILRLRSELRNNVNEKRLAILNLFLDSRTDLDNKGINKRLMLEDLLFSSWRLIKS